MDDALLVRVLHGGTDIDEEAQAVLRIELLFVTELGDGHASDQLHDKERPAGLGGTGIVDLGDARVIHHGQRLALGLEPGDHLMRVHAELDYLEGDQARHPFGLLGLPDGAKAALANLLDKLIAPNDIPGLLSKAGRSLTGLTKCLQIDAASPPSTAASPSPKRHLGHRPGSESASIFAPHSEHAFSAFTICL